MRNLMPLFAVCLIATMLFSCQSNGTIPPSNPTVLNIENLTVNVTSLPSMISERGSYQREVIDEIIPATIIEFSSGDTGIIYQGYASKLCGNPMYGPRDSIGVVIIQGAVNRMTFMNTMKELGAITAGNIIVL